MSKENTIVVWDSAEVTVVLEPVSALIASTLCVDGRPVLRLGAEQTTALMRSALGNRVVVPGGEGPSGDPGVDPRAAFPKARRRGQKLRAMFDAKRKAGICLRCEKKAAKGKTICARHLGLARKSALARSK